MPVSHHRRSGDDSSNPCMTPKATISTNDNVSECIKGLGIDGIVAPRFIHAHGLPLDNLVLYTSKHDILFHGDTELIAGAQIFG